MPLKKALYLSTAALFLYAAPSILAQVGYSTNFDNPSTFTAGNTLSDQDGWVTNDESTNAPTYTVGQSDYVGVINNYSATAADNWAYLGGLGRPTYTPGRGNVSLSRPFDISTGNGSLSFNVDFGISSSSMAFPSRDTFSWAVNASGVQMVSLVFTPNPSDTTKLKMSLSYGIGGTTTLNPDPSHNQIAYNAIYHLSLNVDQSEKVTVVISDGNNMKTTIFSNVDVSSSGVASTAQVTEVAANWLLANPTPGTQTSQTNAGSNALLFNNYAAVPEPSATALMGIAGIGGLMTLARRRKN